MADFFGPTFTESIPSPTSYGSDLPSSGGVGLITPEIYDQIRAGSHPGSSAASVDPYSMVDLLQDVQREVALQQQEASQSSADRAMDFSERMQERSYRLQREARQTAYEDMIKSLERAGLNPALALYSGGTASGLSSVAAPSGTSASMASANISNENITEEEIKSKRSRDAKIWSAVLSALASITSSGISAAAKIATES